MFLSKVINCCKILCHAQITIDQVLEVFILLLCDTPDLTEVLGQQLIFHYYLTVILYEVIQHSLHKVAILVRLNRCQENLKHGSNLKKIRK